MLKLFNNKVLLQEVKPKLGEGEIIYEDKDEVKLGQVAFDWKGENIKLQKGDEVYFQYGSTVKIDGVEYQLVSESNLIAQK